MESFQGLFEDVHEVSLRHLNSINWTHYRCLAGYSWPITPKCGSSPPSLCGIRSVSVIQRLAAEDSERRSYSHYQVPTVMV